MRKAKESFGIVSLDGGGGIDVGFYVQLALTSYSVSIVFAHDDTINFNE